MIGDASPIGALDRIAARASGTAPAETLRPRLPTIFEQPAGRTAEPDEREIEAMGDADRHRGASGRAPAVVDTDSPTANDAPRASSPARQSAVESPVDVTDRAPIAAVEPARVARASAPRSADEPRGPVRPVRPPDAQAPSPDAGSGRSSDGATGQRRAPQPAADQHDRGFTATDKAAVAARLPEPAARDRPKPPTPRPLVRADALRPHRRDPAADEGTTVHVTIGRVEIRAVAPPLAAGPPAPRPRRSAPSGLDGYLGRRSRGARS